jgi:hypothetical protein
MTPHRPQDVLLAETVARHFPGAAVDGHTARLRQGLSIECEVNGVNPIGAYQAASLFFRLRGGAFGTEPIFTSVSGYDKTAKAAVVTGGCNWACAFGPVLESALAGRPAPATGKFPDAEQFEVELDGRQFRVVVAAVDRTMTLEKRSGDPGARIAAARSRLGAEPWLTSVVLGSETLPLLTASGPTLLSVFVSDHTAGRTVEVKVNGADWVRCGVAFAGAPPEPAGAVTLLRELAVLLPADKPPMPGRIALERTLSGFSPVSANPWEPAGWQGWRAHRGELGLPVAAAELVELERDAGGLPADYRAFLTEVAGSGAGPGYGLLRPRVRGDVIPLAHAGCGVTWLLHLQGERRGEVWVDAGGSDRSYSRVADSFTTWYAAWLDAAVRGLRPWVQWDARYCATPAVLSQMLDAIPDAAHAPGGPTLAGRIGTGAISLTNGGGYLPAGVALDPCQACVTLASELGLAPDVFAPGILSGGVDAV